MIRRLLAAFVVWFRRRLTGTSFSKHEMAQLEAIAAERNHRPITRLSIDGQSISVQDKLYVPKEQ